MTEFTDIFETLMRGAAAGISILLAFVLLAGGPGAQVRRLAALFSFSTAFYILLSGEASRQIFGGVLLPISYIAVVGTVFFWWLAAALFDDNFRWRWWRLLPFFALPVFHSIHVIADQGPIERVFWYAHIGMNVAMFIDAFRLAVANAADDLVDPRRRFRVVIAVTVALVGLTIAGAETIERSYLLPDAALMLQAAAILLLNFVFSAWLLAPRLSLFESAAPAPVEIAEWTGRHDKVRAADRKVFEKLMALMDEGVYRQEGLSVSGLAERVGTPEHQLRKLINGTLGFRNFSAFLNARRVEDAKAILADPENARRQVLQIALDLGYGSIAPFNRAFKQATGTTPTQFRKNAIGDG
ncbi:MAG: helix-turn-helix domain-containing protein [Pseudomonadota bacterium]